MLAVTSAIVAFAAAPTVLAQSCPVNNFDFDFSNVMSGCGDLNSAEGCDECFASLLAPAVSVLDYIPIDENSTCDTFQTAVADVLGGCSDAFSSAIGNQLGFRALGLRGLQNCPTPPPITDFPKLAAVATNYYASKGVDVTSLCQ